SSSSSANSFCRAAKSISSVSSPSSTPSSTQGLGRPSPPLADDDALDDDEEDEEDDDEATAGSSCLRFLDEEEGAKLKQGTSMSTKRRTAPGCVVIVVCMLGEHKGWGHTEVVPRTSAVGNDERDGVAGDEGRRRVVLAQGE